MSQQISQQKVKTITKTSPTGNSSLDKYNGKGRGGEHLNVQNSVMFELRSADGTIKSSGSQDS